MFYNDDVMLKCEYVDYYFFVDAFYSTKKAKKSSMFSTCFQIFATTKEIVCLVPSKHKDEVLISIKYFPKEKKDTDEILMDST